MNDFENGLSDCNKALKIDDKNIKGLFRRATCLVNMSTCTMFNRYKTETLKNLDLALEDLKKALYIDNNNQPVKDLLSKAILLKNEYIDKNQMNSLPSEMLKCITSNIKNEQDKNPTNLEEFHNKWLEFYKHILSNGTHDIIFNNSCCRDLIYILERFTYISNDFVNSQNDSENNKLYHYIIFSSWNILSILLEGNDTITGEEDPNINENNSFMLQLNKINSNSSNKDLIKFKSLIRMNNKIINFHKIKDFICNFNSIIYKYQLEKINPKQILDSIFNVLICIFDDHDCNHNHLVHAHLFTYIINYQITNNNNQASNNEMLLSHKYNTGLFLLILRNLSIIFQQRKSKGTKIEALDYNIEIENLIKSLLSLSFHSFQSLLPLPNKENNNNQYDKIIQGCEFILIIIFSLLSEKETTNNSNTCVNSISNKLIISQYILNSLKQDNHQENWIVCDSLHFINGLMGLKILHYSNKNVLKGIILNHPQILHCMFLIILTNYSEYNSILIQSNNNPLNFSQDSFNTIIKPYCIEIISLLMEYKEIRISIVKDDNNIVLIYNVCKNIILSNMMIKNNGNINLNELNSCCRLLNGISKTTMENNDILDLFINQLDVLSLLESIWNIFQNNINISRGDDLWSCCIQNSFEVFTILTMHKSFKSKLLNYEMKDKTIINNHPINHENNTKILFILNLLNFPEIYNFNKNSKCFSNTFLYLYISFIQNLITSNHADPSSESQIIDNSSNNDEFKSTYFLKRQRCYNQFNTENQYDFDQSQMEQLEMMYKQLPEYTRNERNGKYDRGDEILAGTFRKLIVEKSNIINFMFIILEKSIANSNKKSTYSLPLVLNIANNIVDLIVNTEQLNQENSKEILSYRGKIIQNGGLKCLLDSITIIDNELETTNYKSNHIFLMNKKYLIDRSRECKQAISKLLIYISPSLISYKLLVECAIKIQTLLEDDHELLQYESALAITNILSKSLDKISQDSSENDSISIRIYNNGLGWSLLKNLCFTDNNLLRAAGLEGLCNFCNKDYVVSNHFISSKSKGVEDLKLFATFSLEKDKRIQIAALGALAMLSSYSDVTRIILDNWNDIGTKIIDIAEEFHNNHNSSYSGFEVKERLLFTLNNFSLYISSQNNKHMSPNGGGDDNINNSSKVNKNPTFLNIHKSIQDCILFLE